jgi:hypothetical protein
MAEERVLVPVCSALVPFDRAPAPSRDVRRQLENVRMPVEDARVYVPNAGMAVANVALDGLAAQLHSRNAAPRSGARCWPVTERDVRDAYDRWVQKLAPGVLAPTLDQVRDAMTQRAWLDAMERARTQWLEELRRAVYVDVRL